MNINLTYWQAEKISTKILKSAIKVNNVIISRQQNPNILTQLVFDSHALGFITLLDSQCTK